MALRPLEPKSSASASSATFAGRGAYYGNREIRGCAPASDTVMAFALWIDDDLAWAQGTHEYRALGAAVIASSDLFTARAFSTERRGPPREKPTFAGLFSSIGDMNRHLLRERAQRNRAAAFSDTDESEASCPVSAGNKRRSRGVPKSFRPRPSYSPPYI